MGWTSSSNAALVYNINFGQIPYEVVPNGIVDVRVYLTETATNGETPLLAAGGNDGLTLLGSKFTFGSGLSIGDKDDYFFPFDEDPIPPGGTSINPLFLNQIIFVKNSEGFVDISGNVDAPSFIEVPVVPGATSYSILLGTVRFTASSTFTGPFALTFVPSAAGLDVNFAGSQAPLVTYTNSVIAVPEPGTMAILAVASLGGATLRWRRRRQSAK